MKIVVIVLAYVFAGFSFFAMAKNLLEIAVIFIVGASIMMGIGMLFEKLEGK
jgi:hypothetical protein